MFPLIRSRSPEKVREILVEGYGARRFVVARGGQEFDAWINRWHSKTVDLGYCSYGAGIEVEFPETEFYHQPFCLHGTAEYRVNRVPRPVGARETCLVPAGSAIAAEFRPGFEEIVLRLSAETVRAKLTALMGSLPGRALAFEPMVRLDTKAGGSLCRAVAHFIEEVSFGDIVRSPAALAEMEQMLVVTFLVCNRSNYSAQLETPERAPASHQMRKVEEFIEAHWNEPLTIEDMSRATALGARSIFHHFKRSRGQSPMNFLKQVRLDRARQMLMRTDAPMSVTEVSFACGFGNLGHFGADYFRRFGEYPSETARKAKAARR